MKTIVFASFPEQSAARAASRAMSAAGFLPVDSDEIRAVSGDFGVRVPPYVVGVSTKRAATAGQLLRGLGAPRVRMIPHETGTESSPEPVDQAGRESFPASDPPAWTR